MRFREVALGLSEDDKVTEAVAAHGSPAALLEGGANAPLRYHRSEALAAYLARRIEESFAEIQTTATALDVALTLVKDVDYRLVPLFIQALRAGDAAAVEAFERIAATDDEGERGRLLYEAARARFYSDATGG